MANNVPVPTYESLDKIYDSSALAKQGPRYNALVEKFTSIYGRKPDFIARSPGRVNLIGEHIDYCGFGVLPMAIERDVIIAVATTDDDSKVRIANMNPKYEPREFDFEGKETIVTIDSTKHEWSNYFKCGYKGMLERADNLEKPKGMYLLMDGTVPAGSGLSSSAAVVCTSALATIEANKLPLSKQELTEIAIVAERNVGVNSGGMDQSASVFSEQQYALHVEFVPRLSTRLVRLPETQPPMAFVIANTLVTADKFVSGPRNYNLRVVETKMAALFLSKVLDLPSSDSLKEVFDSYAAAAGKDNSEVAKYDALLERIANIFPQDSSNGQGYSLEEVSDMTGLPVQTLKEKYMTRFPVETDYFRLVQRTHHVLTEARRVVEFVDVCSKAPANTLEVLGSIMNASQESCDKFFNCSCPEINQVCEIARQHGAYGARLTGAGWGGCTVMLTTESNVPTLIEAIKDGYYRQKFPELSQDQLDDAVLATKPGSGSAVFNGF
ncbi:galactokinase [Zychaea mexicana]|uniref:galactokinase n=1 Tax=Zychaea mexicana TaxID=64656 RepID=UPI0022FE9981|nr:galactokinase [Zychaea mexicana]KAI9497413.1 galactokinase [Zychaea mexicana]